MLFPLWRQCKNWLVSTTRKISMLKLGCTLPNLANICRHKSIDTKFYPFMEADKDLLAKNQEDFVGGRWIDFTGKAVVDDTFVLKSTDVCKSFVGIIGSQLYPFMLCQPIPIGPYTRCDLNSESNTFTPRQNRTRLRKRELISNRDRRKLINSVMMLFLLIATLCLKQWAAFTIFVPFKKCDCISPKRIFNVVVRRESSMNWDQAIFKKNVSLSLKCESLNSGNCTRQALTLKNVPEKTFLTSVHLQLTNY